MNKLFKLIERIEDAILSGVAIPLTPWAVINGEKLLPLLDRVRESLPEEIQASHKVLERRETILEEAQQQALTVMEEARNRSQMMLSESELMRAVRDEAEAVRQQVIGELEAMRKMAFEESEAMKRQAYDESSQLRLEAEAYAERVLTALDTQVSELHSQLQTGKKQMHQMRLEHRTTGISTMADPLARETRTVPSSSMTHRAVRPGDRPTTERTAPERKPANAAQQRPSGAKRRSLSQQQELLNETQPTETDNNPPSPYRR